MTSFKQYELFNKCIRLPIEFDAERALSEVRSIPDDVYDHLSRGLCPVDKRFVAGGSSPSTITLYDLEADQSVASVNLSMDIRNAIHGLEVWPYT